MKVETPDDLQRARVPGRLPCRHRDEPKLLQHAQLARHHPVLDGLLATEAHQVNRLPGRLLPTRLIPAKSPRIVPVMEMCWHTKPPSATTWLTVLTKSGKALRIAAAKAFTLPRSLDIPGSNPWSRKSGALAVLGHQSAGRPALTGCVLFGARGSQPLTGSG